MAVSDEPAGQPRPSQSLGIFHAQRDLQFECGRIFFVASSVLPVRRLPLFVLQQVDPILVLDSRDGTKLNCVGVKLGSIPSLVPRHQGGFAASVSDLPLIFPNLVVVGPKGSLPRTFILVLVTSFPVPGIHTSRYG